MALSNLGAEDAGHHTTDVQDWHAAAPAVFRGCLTLHAGEAPQGAAAGAHVTAAIAEAGAPCPNVLGGLGHHHHLCWLVLDGHA